MSTRSTDLVRIASEHGQIVLPAAISAILALLLVYVFQAPVSTEVAKPPKQDVLKGARVAYQYNEAQFWIDRTGSANWQARGQSASIPQIEAVAGRPLIAGQSDGSFALVWEDGGGNHRIGFFDRIGNEAPTVLPPIPVFTTALAPIGDGIFALGGLDGRVRIADFSRSPPQLTEPGPGAIHVIGMITFLTGTADGRFQAVGRDGRPYEGRYDGEALRDLRLSSRPLPGTHATPIPYAGDAPVVPRAAEARLQRFRECAACPEMVAIPSRRFSMGSPDDEAGRDPDEGPQRIVSVGAFALGLTEVTVTEYRRFAEETGRSENPTGCEIRTRSGWQTESDAGWQDPGFVQNGSHPVTCVSWDDAQGYIAWLNTQVSGTPYRLPSEAEWEFAARAGTATRYWWGDDPANTDQCGAANGADQSAAEEDVFGTRAPCDDGFVNTAPVGSYEANPFGLQDMSGNVWEWVQDCWHASYEGAPTDERPWMESEGGDCNTGRSPRRLVGLWVRGPSLRGPRLVQARVPEQRCRVSRWPDASLKGKLSP